MFTELLSCGFVHAHEFSSFPPCPDNICIDRKESLGVFVVLS